MDDDRFDRLESRVAAIERYLASAQPAAAPPPAPKAAAPTPPAYGPLAPGPASPAVPPIGTPATPGSLERLVAGRGLQIAGGLLVLFGVAFFLELAFTRGWIGPVERILLGLATGSAAIYFGATRLKDAYRGIADALIGVGAGILYLSLWASVAVFPELHVSRLAAFAAMVAVTVLVGVLADVRTSERLGFASLLGGLVTPLLLANGSHDRITLAAYVVALTLGALVLASRRGFVRLEVATLVGSLLYAPAFAPNPDAGWTETSALVVATALFASFALAWTIGYLAYGATRTRLTLLCADFIGYAVVLAAILGRHGMSLGFALLCLASIAIAVAQVPSFPAALSRTYGYLGLAAITLALPSFFHQTNLSLAFTLEAIALIALGMRSDVRLARIGTLFLALMGAVVSLEALSESPSRAIAMAIGLVVWLAGGIFVLGRWYALELGEDADDATAHIARVGVDVVGLVALSRFCLDLIGGPTWNESIPSAAQFALSFVWTAYATFLFVRGLRGRSPLMRWEGLVLFGGTILKVFSIDLASLDVEWRVGSFVGLGVVLFAVSALYTRQMAGTNAAVPATAAAGAKPNGDGA